MGYEPIKVIASAASADGHVNRITEFDDVPQSNKLSYRDGFPILTATPNEQNTRGPRRVDLNGLFYLFSSNLFELQQGNFPTYNPAIVGAGKPLPSGYPLGAVLWYSAGGYFVKSLVPDNTESDLSDINSWEKITISAADLASGLSNKVDLASGTTQADVDYVVETYVNGTSWYRIYKSGWCEQGGYVSSIPTSGGITINFLVPMADAKYSVFGGAVNNEHAANDSRFECYARTTTSMVIDWSNSTHNDPTWWEVKGYIGQED